MRRVLDEAIWLHGSYRFDTPARLRAAVTAAKILMTRGFAGSPLSLACSVVDGNQLLLDLKLPMYEEGDFAATLFRLLARCSQLTERETRVDVL